MGSQAPPMQDFVCSSLWDQPWSLGVPGMDSHLRGLPIAWGSVAGLLLSLEAVMQCPHLVLVAVRMF